MRKSKFEVSPDKSKLKALSEKQLKQKGLRCGSSGRAFAQQA
jgi:hypothetical protein